jgi:GNAT superfamily N-acetyltransferase
MSEHQLEIRTMTRAELDTAIDWAADAGWNPGLGDADCFHVADPDGYLMGFVDGRPAVCISVIAYGQAYGFLGFYIAHPDFRGQGYGIQIWDAGMARFGDRVVGLDGVPDQQHNYRKSGFELAHRNVRYGGPIDPGETVFEGVVDASDMPVERLLAYDRDFFPADRGAFIRCWLTPQSRVAKALVTDGEISGYGVIRQCRDGYKIGPLFADTPAGADTLVRALAREAGGGMIFLDPPEPNAAAIALVERYGLAPSFETARMYKGTAPDLPTHRTFGITTFELG